MKKVLTALGDIDQYNQLVISNCFYIKEKDILYKEGILEFLEKDDDIDIIIFNSKLCPENLGNFLKTIDLHNIKIYLILSDYNKNNYSQFEEIKNIEIFNSIDEILNSIHNISTENVSKKETEKRVISILGCHGVGKTIISSLVGKFLSRNFKVLIINFDIFSDDLQFLFNSHIVFNQHNLESMISKIQKNLYILNGIKYIFNETNKINFNKIKEIVCKLKLEYDYIIFDTSSDINLKYIKTIFPISDLNIFILESNLLEIKKANQLLEVYNLDFELDLNKTYILINKYNVNSVDIDITKDIFKNINYFGKVNYSSKINSYINNFTKDNIKIDDLKNIQKLLK